jgi:4-azaleucine resistance transporter AzlC
MSMIAAEEHGAPDAAAGPSARSQFLAGVRGILPILTGTIPFGMVYGVAAVQAGLPAALAQAMSAIIFAGSAQFIVTQLIAAGAPGLVLLLTGFVINLRHMLYSASVAPYLRGAPLGWKALLAYVLTDEAYAVAIIHFRRADQPHRRWFLLGAGLTLWAGWQASSAAGIFLGAQIPAGWGLDFTITLTFIALIVPALRDRAGLGAALVAGLVAVLVGGFPLKLGLLVAALAGLLAGLALDRTARP